MGVLKGSVTIQTATEVLVYSEDPDVVVGADRVKAGWIRKAEALSLGSGADVVTVQPLGADQVARWKDHLRRSGPGTATLEALRMGVVEVRCAPAGKRTTLKGKGALTYIEALTQQDATAGDLLSDCIHRLTGGMQIEESYAYARRVLGYEPPPPEGDDGESREEADSQDDATFPGQSDA